MIWSDGVSRFDIAISLRLLERKFLRVDTGLWVSEEADIGALGDIAPSWTYEEDLERDNFRAANFSIRIDAAPNNWVETDEYEGTLLHEFVHAAQMERRGVGPSSADFTRARSDEDGSLGREATIAFYRLFPYEREAKQQEIAIVLGPADRDYWRGILAGSQIG